MTARYFGLLPAAGSAARFGAAGLKQYANIAGKPMLRHSIQRLLALPVVDTGKRGDDERRIVATESREGLWRAQTPQMFRHGMLLRALREVEHVTDEASAVERLGYKPRLVEGSARNLKVTLPSDLAIAEAIF